MSATTIILVILVIIVVFVELIYAARASTSISSISNYDKDMMLDTAYKYLVTITSIGFILFILLLIGGAFLIFGGSESLFTFGTVADISLLIVIVLLLTVGIIAAIAASDIGQSTPYKSNDVNALQAYNYAVIAAVSGIFSFTFAAFSIFAYSTPNITTTTIIEE